VVEVVVQVLLVVVVEVVIDKITHNPQQEVLLYQLKVIQFQLVVGEVAHLVVWQVAAVGVLHLLLVLHLLVVEVVETEIQIQMVNLVVQVAEAVVPMVE
jgi:hypothetical protein